MKPFKHSFIFFLKWWLAFALSAIWMRFRSIAEAELLPFGSDYLWVLFEGVLADVLVAFCLATLCVAFRRYKIMMLSIVSIYALCLAGNSIFIVANGANIDFTMAGQATNDTFISGVMLTREYGIELMHASFFLILVYLLPCGWFMLGGAFGFAALFLQFTLPNEGAGLPPAWVATHMFEDNIDALAPFNKDKHKVTPANVEAFFLTDLEAEPIIDYPDSNNRPNVLMIILESVGMNRVKRGQMPYLESLRNKSLYYDDFYISAQVTSNGLYALFCADYPGLMDPHVSAIKAWALYKKKNKKQRFCLPNLLAQHGYQTVFMTAAKLGFQSKGRINPLIGFETSYEKNQLLPILEDESAWGKDDVELYKHVRKKIASLSQEDKPWFISVLTVTTHHPAVVPEWYMQKHKSRGKGENINRYADMALKKLMASLEKDGVLDNTVVVITSDEVRTRSGKEMQKKLRRNHGVLAILTPNKDVTTINTTFGQTDIMLSIADYLGLPTKNIPIGRSVFRNYTDFAPFFMTHFFAKKIYIFPEENRVFSCHKKELEKCKAFEATKETAHHPLFAKQWSEMPFNEMWKNIILNISKRNDDHLVAPMPEAPAVN